MSRRAADDGPLGQPDSKRPKTGAALDIAAIRAQIAERKAAAEARLKDAPRPAGPAALPPKMRPDAMGGSGDSMQDRVAAVRARIDAMKGGSASGGGGGGSSSNSSAAPILPSLSSNVGLHPLLMGDFAPREEEKNEKKALANRYKTMAPKYSTVKANQSAVQAAPAPVVVAPILNPYATEEGNDRRARKFQFAQPGRFVRQGDQLRNEAKMEALKQRIAEASKKAGLEGEFDTLERSLKRQPPPDVEWWDKAILGDDKGYDDLDSLTFDHSDSLITHLIQHPIPIPAPGDKKQPERGLMLTKKEQKKMRRQRRMAELEDKRDRQKMGLLPPDPPKVRLANLMKVLTSDAVQDPTKVEQKVRREVAARADKHEQDNLDRKLTVEERKEKEYQQQLARERKGVYGAVYKIKYLTNGQHKFKVRETAKRDNLSGVCIFSSNFALVVVEGVDKSVKHYKRLMLGRIDWTEQARPMDKAVGGDAEGSDEDEGGNDGDEEGDLADNKCELIWEGEVPERAFKTFRARHAETDTKAKEWLPGRWEGMWDLAKRWVWQGEDL